MSSGFDRVKMSDKFCLKWNDFQSTVSQSFGVLRREEDFFDVTLVSEDETQIPAHKLVLSASSDFFKNILRRNTHSHPLLYLSGVDSQSLGLVLDYIYQGEVQIYQENLNSFLDIAQRLKIEGLQSNGESLDGGSSNQESYKDKKSEADIDVKDILIDVDEKVPKKSQNMTRRLTQNKIVPAVQSMSSWEVDDRIQELIERREGLLYCQVCDYKTNKLSNVKEHVEIHIEGLCYTCQFCDKTFRSKNSYRVHIKRNHAAN